MSFYPPTLHTDNTVFNELFKVVSSPFKGKLAALFLKECYIGNDYEGFVGMSYHQLAIVYVWLIDLRFRSVGNTLTIEEIQNQFEYNTIKKCFACKAIDLDSLIDALQDDP